MGSVSSLRFLSTSLVFALACAGCTLVTAAPPPGQKPAGGSTSGDGPTGGSTDGTGGGSSSGGADQGSGSGSSGGSAGDAGAGGDGSTSSVPTSIRVTGQLTTVCSRTLFSEPDCTLTIKNIATNLSLPAGTKLRTVFELAGQNKNPPDPGGWLSGLTVTTPDYPPSCVIGVQWADNAGTSLWFVIQDKDAQGNDCGLTARAEVSADDFANGFDAVVPATWVATGAVVPVTFHLTP